jgi:formylglycine-generating enzyme required for sulfatase activity
MGGYRLGGLRRTRLDEEVFFEMVAGDISVLRRAIMRCMKPHLYPEVALAMGAAMLTACHSPIRVTDKQPEPTDVAQTADVIAKSTDGQRYVWIPPGKFLMGCSAKENDNSDTVSIGCVDNKPPRSVVIPKGFWMGQTEVTQAEYRRVTGKNPSLFAGDRLPVSGMNSDLLPVETVTLNEAKIYCAAIGGRLPTAEEWEYAARAGTTGELYGNLDEIAWYGRNSYIAGANYPPGFCCTHEVGRKKPNAWGLFDTLGNVAEFVADGSARGGSWHEDTWYMSVSSDKTTLEPGQATGNIGFRCIKQ